MTQKFSVIVADPPWKFKDKLKMSKIKRGAESQYNGVLTNQQIKELPIQDFAEKDSILVLWVPSAILDVGIDVLNSWGFKLKQTFVWVKIQKLVSIKLFDLFLIFLKSLLTFDLKKIKKAGKNFSCNLNQFLSMYMGNIFRQTHEIALIGTKGKIISKIKNKSQRSVILAENKKHSEKPEELQDRLELLFTQTKKLELFARRDRIDWTCFGNECPSSYGEDINESLKKLKNL